MEKALSIKDQMGVGVVLIMMIVPITVYVLTQSSVMQTMASSGVKE